MFIDNGEGLYNLGLMISEKLSSFIEDKFSPLWSETLHPVDGQTRSV